METTKQWLFFLLLIALTATPIAAAVLLTSYLSVHPVLSISLCAVAHSLWIHGKVTDSV